MRLAIFLVLAMGLPAPAQPERFAILESLYGVRTPRPFCVVDIDGDGDVDIVDQQGGVHLNDGHGSFTAMVPGPALPVALAGLDLRQAASMDLDGDGDLDVLAPRGARVEFWENLGGGALGSFTPVGPAPVSLAVLVTAGDLDGDGDKDLVVLNVRPVVPVYIADQVQIWSNVGGAFVDVTPSALLGVRASRQAELQDVDADGDLDLLVADTTELPNLFLNDGAGNFTTAPGGPLSMSFGAACALGDVDADGFPDLVLASGGSSPQVVFRRNLGAGLLGAPQQLLGPPPYQDATPHLIDVDGDGAKELLLATSNIGAYVYDMGVSGFGALRQILPTPGAFVLPSDLDGDGDVDGLVSGAQIDTVLAGTVRVVFNDGAGTLYVAGGALAPEVSMQPLSGDLDGDGDVDILLFDGIFRVIENDGRGNLRWNPQVGNVPGSAPGGFYVEQGLLLDADGDGALDFLGTGIQPSLGVRQTAIWLNRGSVWIPAPPLPGTVAASLYRQMAVGDFDGDGQGDIALGPPQFFFGGGGRVTTLRGLGGGQFAAPVEHGVAGVDVSALNAADMDGDGDLDLVMGDLLGPSQVLLNDGSGAFPTWWAGLPQVSELVVGDLDGDGLPDVEADGIIRRNAGGTGAFPYWATLQSPGGFFASGTAIVDLDGDGQRDVAHRGGRWWRNTGPGLWLEQSLTPFAAPVGDLDADGDEDLVSQGYSHIEAVSNLTRHLSAAAPSRPGRPTRLDLHGEPGIPFALWVASSPASLGVPEGIVQIDPATAVPVFQSSLDAVGRSSLSINVPNLPGLGGITYYWQAVFLEANGARLSPCEATTIQIF